MARSFSRRDIGVVAASLVGTTLTALVVSASVAGACSYAGLGDGVQLTGGSTTLTLGSRMATTLGSDGIQIGSTPGAVATRPVSLPVSGGLIWSGAEWGAVKHNGPLVITNNQNGRQVTFESLNLALLPDPGVSATTPSGSGLALFKVHLRAQPATAITLSGGAVNQRIGYRDIRLQLTPAAARYLNQQLGTAAFSGGEAVGQVTVNGVGTPSMGAA